MNVTTIGIDLAKSVFQLHGIDADGEVIFRKKLRRSAVLDFLRDLPPCLIGLEACATAHCWAREIGALGYDVRLIPPAYVKPYMERQKNDAADAEAIGASSLPSSAWYRARTPPAARRVSGGYRKWAMVICAGFWWSGRHR